MTVTVNGEPDELATPTTVADLVQARLPGSASGIAVAVNGEVVPRAAHAATMLAPGDRVEIVTAVQGG